MLRSRAAIFLYFCWHGFQHTLPALCLIHRAKLLGDLLLLWLHPPGSVLWLKVNIWTMRYPLLIKRLEAQRCKLWNLFEMHVIHVICHISREAEKTFVARETRNRSITTLRWKERENMKFNKTPPPNSCPLWRPYFINFPASFESLGSLKCVSFPTPQTSLGWCLLLLTNERH